MTFEEAFEEQFPPVYNYIYYHVGSAAEAEDLTADVFVRAYEYWGSYSPLKGSRGAWLGGIARNTVKTYFQKKARRPQTIEIPESICTNTNIEEDYLHKEKVQQLFKLMDELPEHQREMLCMKYLLCFTNRDIAKITGISESNVGVTLHRTIKELKKNIETL